MSKRRCCLNLRNNSHSGGVNCRKTLTTCSSLRNLFLLLVAINLFDEQLGVVNCEPSQEQSRAQQNELSQDSFGPLSSSSSSLNSDGLAAVNSYGRPGAYVNSKRARKMSAFMPMRGRKDGRDLLAAANSAPLGLGLGNNHDHHQQSQPQQHTYLVPISLVQQQLDGLQGATNYYYEPHGGGGGSGQRALREPEPVVNEMSLSRLIDLAVDDYSAMGGPREGLGGGVVSGSGLQGGGGGGWGGAYLMDAKSRRAFHPMRGKRSDAADSTQLTGGELGTSLTVDSSSSSSWPVAFSQDDIFE